MDPAHLMTQQATIAHVSNTGPPDPYGNPSEVVTTSTSPCFLSYGLGSEADAQAVPVTAPILYLPADVVVDHGDRLTVDSVAYEFDGPPARHYNPRLRRVTHVQALVRLAT